MLMTLSLYVIFGIAAGICFSSVPYVVCPTFRIADRCAASLGVVLQAVCLLLTFQSTDVEAVPLQTLGLLGLASLSFGNLSWLMAARFFGRRIQPVSDYLPL